MVARCTKPIGHVPYAEGIKIQFVHNSSRKARHMILWNKLPNRRGKQPVLIASVGPYRHRCIPLVTMGGMMPT